MKDYKTAVVYSDIVETRYLQQGHRDDVSPYTFEELMKEISA